MAGAAVSDAKETTTMLEFQTPQITAEEVDVCDFDPGYDVAVSVTGTLRRMVEIWRGDLGWPAAIRSGSIQLQGPEPVRRAVPTWFPPSQFAAVPRSAVDITALAG